MYKVSDYKVSDIARFVLECTDRNLHRLSNLQLQNILYLLWKGYYKENQEVLFDDDYFFAWKFAPVVPSVYYEYYMYGAYPITLELLKPFNSNIRVSDEIFIASIVEKYKGASVADLLKETRVIGGAWDRIFANGKGAKEIIPFREIGKDALKNI